MSKKNIFSILLVTALISLASCAKEEIGGTKVQDMCGEWYVAVDYIDEDGNVLQSYGDGYSIFTYNTNADLDNEMYLDDDDFFGFRLIVKVNYADKTFSVTDGEDDYYGQVLSVRNGSIVKDGAESWAGYITDAINFILEDTYYDEDLEEMVTDLYWYHGFRRTGLAGGYD